VKDHRAQYTKRDISKIIVGLSIRTVQYYTDFGIVVPDISPSQGRGKTRIYSERNLVQFAMIEFMTSNLRVDLNTAKHVMDTLRKGYFVREWATRPSKESFYDFFSDEQWGVDKELAYSEDILVDERETMGMVVRHNIFPLVDVIVLRQKQDLVGFDPSEKVPMVANRILWLGQIKRRAVLDILGMKSLLSTGASPF